MKEDIVWNQAYGLFTRTGDAEWLDINVCSEVLTQDCYKLKQFDGDEIRRIIDIGAHIGSFANAAYRRWPDAHITCVEACPENMYLLERNAPFAEVIQAACTYEDGDVHLLNSVMEGATATGSSIVVSAFMPFSSEVYWNDVRPLAKVMLEELVGDATCDLLKLDCEWSEFSILENAQCLDQVRHIVGEYHDKARWHDLVKRKFSGWHHDTLLSIGENQGIFRLSQP